MSEMAWGQTKREVLRTVIDAGEDGIGSRDVCELLWSFDIPVNPHAVRGLLSRLKREGILRHKNHKYLAK